jgi:hypothetical protein
VYRPSFHLSVSSNATVVQMWGKLLNTSSFWLSLILTVTALSLKMLYFMLIEVEFCPSEVQVILEVR